MRTYNRIFFLSQRINGVHFPNSSKYFMASHAPTIAKHIKNSSLVQRRSGKRTELPSKESKSKKSKAEKEPKNVLSLTTRAEFRDWLMKHHDKERECWIVAKRGLQGKDQEGVIWYLDSVEEALCFGWIDTTRKNINKMSMQKFTPRVKHSQWSELNKERCRRLEKLGLMTDAGRAVLPDMTEQGFVIDDDILKAFKEHPTAWKNFQSFPALYQRVRIDTIQRSKNKGSQVFENRMKKLIEQSEAGKMFGEWNDYGRLLGY